MKKFLIFFCTILVLLFNMLFLSSCSNKNVQKSIKEFLNIYYTVSDYNIYTNSIDTVNSSTNNYLKIHEKFKPYLTEESYEDILNSRVYFLFLKSNYEQKSNSSIKSISLKKVSEDKDKNLVVFNYNLKLLLSYPNTKKQVTLNESGQIQAYNKENMWKFVFVPDMNMLKKNN